MREWICACVCAERKQICEYKRVNSRIITPGNHVVVFFTFTTYLGCHACKHACVCLVCAHVVTTHILHHRSCAHVVTKPCIPLKPLLPPLLSCFHARSKECGCVVRNTQRASAMTRALTQMLHTCAWIHVYCDDGNKDTPNTHTTRAVLYTTLAHGQL